MRITVRGLTFDVTTGGTPEGEPVLLLHGFPQHSWQWDLVTPLLHDAGLRTYAFDQRGYGARARPDQVADYRVTELVADTVAVLDELGVESVHLVGHDWGAIVAWHLAARHPDRLRTLTAVSVPHPVAVAYALRTDPQQRERLSYTTLFQRAGKAERVLLAGDAAALRALIADVAGTRADRYVAAMSDPDTLTAALNWYRAMAVEDVTVLDPVEVPVTYVWSDADPAIGATAARAWSSGFWSTVI